MTEPEFIMAINRSRVFSARQMPDQRIIATSDKGVKIYHESKRHNKMTLKILDTDTSYDIPSHVELDEIILILKAGTRDDVVAYSDKYLRKI